MDFWSRALALLAVILALTLWRLLAGDVRGTVLICVAGWPTWLAAVAAHLAR